MNSAFFNLNNRDAVKGLVVFVLAAVFGWLAQVLGAPGFDYVTFNWGELIKVALVSGMAYLSKNLMTTEDGKVLGKI